MSNHTGGYLLNEVLGILIREKFVETLGKEKAQQIVLEVVEVARRRYDCNYGEILEGYAQTLGICSYCLTASNSIKGGHCRTCRQKWVERNRRSPE